MSTETPRRAFLKLTGLSTAGLLMTTGLGWRTSRAANRPRSNGSDTDYEIIIIGAGLAGLTAARRLEKAGITNLLILEASSWVGGRTLNLPIAGGYVAETGGQWIGPGQTAIAGMLNELGLSSFPSYTTGTNVEPSPLSSEAQLDLDQAIAQLDTLAQTVPLEAPWTAQNAAIWDNMTVADWILTQLATVDASVALSLTIASFLANPESISFLYFLYYVHSAGNFEALRDDAQSDRITGGSQRIALEMANQLTSPILLASPATSIDDRGDHVVVSHCETTASAQRVIVAMMPADANKLSFTPALPTQRQNLHANWVGSPGVKISVSYPTPFWRNDGLSGTAFGNVGQVFDNSPDDASSGILVVFPFDELRDQPPFTRQAAVLNELASFFGPAAQNPLDYVEYDWSTVDSVSGCVSPLPPRVLTEYGPALREPVGRIHWAGTETSELWTGYMEGAIRSGERVAVEVIALARSSSSF